MLVTNQGKTQVGLDESPPQMDSKHGTSRKWCSTSVLRCRNRRWI